jgi:hypothetical protein
MVNMNAKFLWLPLYVQFNVYHGKRAQAPSEILLGI